MIKEKNQKEKNYIAILWNEHVKRYLGLFILSTYCAVLFSICMGMIATFIEKLQVGLADIGQSSENIKYLIIVGIILLLFGICAASFQYLQFKLSNIISLKIINNIQNKIFRKLLFLDEVQIGKIGVGQIASYFSSDLIILRESLLKIATVQRDLFTLITLVCVLGYFDIFLLAVILGIYFFASIPIYYLSNNLRNTAKKVQNQMGDISSFIIQSVQGRKVIASYKLEDYQTNKAKNFFHRRYILSTRMVHFKALNEPVIFIIGSFAIMMVIFIAVYRISVNDLTVEKFISFLLVFLLLSQPARSIASFNAILQEGLSAFERLDFILSLKSNIRSTTDIINLHTNKKIISSPNIEFRKVNFAYDENESKKIIDDFSLFIPRNNMYAFVGASGGGKSTILSLLLRLYDITDGKIFINDRLITDYDISDLRGAISYVGQETTIFSGTIYENIRIGNFNATLEEVYEATKKAGCYDFINSFKDGFETKLYPFGDNLSVGQKQRIAIARAFLKNSPILLLDEVTSALDAKSEYLISETLEELKKDKTCIVIAHRLSTVKTADQIIVIDKGKIVEQGTHEELMTNFGQYAELVAKQDLKPS